MAGPAFGSPAWREKYGRGAAKNPALLIQGKITPAARGKVSPSGTSRPRGRQQPIAALASSISSLESAISTEPEESDKATLEGCLGRMKVVQGKNESEEGS
jgi:hypothetical protein